MARDISHAAVAALYADLYSECSKLWYRVHARFGSIQLPCSSDWDDIRAEAISRVFNRLERYSPARGDRRAWAFTIMTRCTINALRRYLPRQNRKHSEWQERRMRVVWPRRLRTQVMQISIYGDEETVVIPDIVDSQTESLVWVADFRSILVPRDQQLLDRLVAGETIASIARRWHTPYQRLHTCVQRLRARLREYLIGSENGQNGSESSEIV